MRRLAFVAAVGLALLLNAQAAWAANPSVGPVSYTNLQGVSVVLKSTVNPEGESTSYLFEYSTDPGFAGAAQTPSVPIGADTAAHPARAEANGLSPSTTYYYRIRATNNSGATVSPSASFETTQGFGFLPGTAGFSVNAYADGGGPADEAGLHPYQVAMKVGLNQAGEFEDQPGVVFSDGDLRDLRLELPPGMLLNPNAIESCTQTAFHTPRSNPFEHAESLSGESCPDRSQVGTVEISTSRGGGEQRRFGLFNLNPPPGVAAQLGFSPFGVPVVIDIAIRGGSDGTYTMVLEADDIPQTLDFHAVNLDLWGTPWALSHNGERGNCLNEAEPQFEWAKCLAGNPAQYPPRAYLTLPTACSGPLFFRIQATSWQQAARPTALAVNRDMSGQEISMKCDGLIFEPTPQAQLNDTKASSPSGYSFRLSNNLINLTEPTQTLGPAVKQAVVRLPNGATLNPSVAAGLGVCRPGQFAAETAFSLPGAGCPNASNLGDFSVRSPLLDGYFQGYIYLAQADDPKTPQPGAENPFDSFLAVYLVARLPQRGVLIKVAGRIEPDRGTGNLVATFDGLPQLPYSELDLTFRTGQRAFLVTPPSCGSAVSVTESTPWALALSPTKTTVSSFAPVVTATSTQISAGIGGGPCPSGLPPFQPTVTAGGVNSNVNSFTPYYVHITRRDTEQELTSYSLDLPQGITAKLAGIPFCSDAAIAAARTRRGTDETREPSCSDRSQVGTVVTGYGVGSALTYTTGRVYLAGPYNGQPLSLVVINPATVGPFDLGTVVIRSAFSVDPHTAKLALETAASDHIPHILEGVVLHLREVRIFLDRAQFTHNPSSCAPSQMISRLTGSGADANSPADDSLAVSSVHFQLLNCRILGFKPKLGVRLRGGTKRRAYPQLRVTFASRGSGDTNLKEIAVALPHSQFLAQEHIRSICTRVQFAQERCPEKSVYGKAVAYTPLFDEPLRGSVYLRSSSGQLPDLVATLRAGAVRIDLDGHISGTKQGGIKARFEDLPDQPVERFVMTLFGGKRGLLQNSSDICAVPPLAQVKALGQTNLGRIFTTTLRGQCGKKKRKAGNHRRHEKAGRHHS